MKQLALRGKRGAGKTSTSMPGGRGVNQAQHDLDIVTLAPSSLDYKVKACPRCFYLDKKMKIKVDSFPPPVFSNFDIVQQNYFKNLNTNALSSKLPSGRIMLKDDLPGRVVSEVLQDSKGRSYIIGGRPDIVIQFDDGSYGIIDFKTTQLNADKAENYKFQLEAYAQIFSHPGSIKKGPTPKLDPISHIGILQFFPSEIFAHQEDSCHLNFAMSYVPLKRNIDEFYERIEHVLDILSLENPPDFNQDCKDCLFVQKQMTLSS